MRILWRKKSEDNDNEPLLQAAVRVFLLALLVGAVTISALHAIAWLLSHD